MSYYYYLIMNNKQVGIIHPLPSWQQSSASSWHVNHHCSFAWSGGMANKTRTPFEEMVMICDIIMALSA